MRLGHSIVLEPSALSWNALSSTRSENIRCICRCSSDGWNAVSSRAARSHHVG